MNKSQLISAAAQSAGISQKDAERLFNAVVDTVTASLTRGEKVQISGFGSFEVKNREARTGRNPRTKEAVHIPATRTPVFKPSKALKDTVGK